MPQTSLTSWLNKPKAVKEPTVIADEVALSPASANLPQPSKPPSSKEKQNDIQDPALKITASFKSSQKPLPPNVELRPCRKEDIPSLKHLTSLLLPIPYQDRFYKEIIEDPLTNNITLLAVWHDDPTKSGLEKGRLVGAIRCRLLNQPPSSVVTTKSNDGPMLYLSTLVLLSPYRRHGIATHLLHTLTKRAVDTYGFTSVGAHVWEANAEGLEWYRKRGFREVGREKGYYRKLNPSDAVVMQRIVSVMDFVRE
jgi:ribosomal protein S18 acetylase RimI-like enzyme